MSDSHRFEKRPWVGFTGNKKTKDQINVHVQI